MSKHNIYKITILGWAKWNGNLKKGHHCILLSTGFLSDAKIKTLPSGGKLLYLGLLLRCGELKASFIEASYDQLVTFAGGSGQVVSRLLDQLQALQLLTYEVSSPLLDMIGKDRIGDDRKGTRRATVKKETSPQPAEGAPSGTNIVIAHYCDLWKARYKTASNPLIGGKEAGTFKTLIKDFGVEKAMAVIEAYLKMPDQWFVTRRHDIATLKLNLNAVVQFMDSGKIITRKEIQQLDISVTNQNTREALEKGEV